MKILRRISIAQPNTVKTISKTRQQQKQNNAETMVKKSWKLAIKSAK